MKRILIFALSIVAISVSAYGLTNAELQLEPIAIKGVKTQIKITAYGSATEELEWALHTENEEIITGKTQPASTSVVEWTPKKSGKNIITLASGGEVEKKVLRVLPGILTILPPLLAILLALATRQVLVSLLTSIWLGAFFIYDFHPLSALWRTADKYLLESLADRDDAAMLLFIIFMGGCIGVISKSGGMQGVVRLLKPLATTPRRTQLMTWFLGLFIFFDDYANTIIVGNTMKPISDNRRISREKLAYIVDSTSAPVASIALISTWIGLEVGLINDAFESINLSTNGYIIFVKSLPYRFYPLLTLVLGFLIVFLNRDFGPMLKAEVRARLTGKVVADGSTPLASLREDIAIPPDGAPQRWYNALVPIAVVIVATAIGLWYHGKGQMSYEEFQSARAWQVFSSADANIVLCWSSLLGSIVAVLMVISQRILTLTQSMEAWLGGVQSMLIAIIVLLFAWSLGSICKELHTADYLTGLLMGKLSPHLLPVITFILAAIISFATGTSYGTMGILTPLVVPITFSLCTAVHISGAELDLLLLGVVSSVLAGSIFGDHCSPISDTTIMSSMASSSDHVDHVKTQLPYALLVAVVGMIVGDIPTAYGFPVWASLLIGTVVLAVFLLIFGKIPEKLIQEKADEDS